MIRLTIFIIALLLAIGTVDPTGPWLVTLAVLSGIELLRFRGFPFRRYRWRRWFNSPWEEEFDW